MTTRQRRLTSKVTTPMRPEVVEALDASANALGITRADCIREGTQMWLRYYYAPLSQSETGLPEWVVRIIENDEMSHDEKQVAVWELVQRHRASGQITDHDEVIITRELQRDFMEVSRRLRAGR